MKTLVIVESPAKAEKIQGYLGDDFVVEATKGHITELKHSGPYNAGIDIDNGFKPSYVLMPEKVSVLDKLLNLAKQSDLILLATDPDKEGAAIAWHVATRLEDVGKPMKRMIFNKISEKALKKAVEDSYPLEKDFPIIDSQKTRQMLDRLVGYTTSPFLMSCFGPKLSAGRVQSVVTRMVVDREQEIDNFVPQDYWTILASLSNSNSDVFIAKYPEKLLDQPTADAVYNDILNSKTFVVAGVVGEDEKKAPPAPMITSTLQRTMSRLHNMSAEQTMEAAQWLYESGFITYLRTDSVRISDESMDMAKDWLKTNGFAIPKKPNVYKNKDSSQDAHECIYPIDVNLIPNKIPEMTDKNHILVYDVIWKYFLASQMPPAIFSTVKITLMSQKNKKLMLRASGRTIKDLGYLKFLGSDDIKQMDLPTLKVGDVVSLCGKMPVKLDKKQTQPPPRFSEDKLINELETRGIGRPATYAALLSKITSRNYVEKKGNVFYPTDLGKNVVNMLLKYFTFMDYDFTKVMEENLDEISQTKIAPIEILNKFFSQLKSELESAYTTNGSMLCEKCGAPMRERTVKSTNDKFLGCSEFPRCKFTVSKK